MVVATTVEAVVRVGMEEWLPYKDTLTGLEERWSQVEVH